MFAYLSQIKSEIKKNNFLSISALISSQQEEEAPIEQPSTSEAPRYGTINNID